MSLIQNSAYLNRAKVYTNAIYGQTGYKTVYQSGTLFLQFCIYLYIENNYCVFVKHFMIKLI